MLSGLNHLGFHKANGDEFGRPGSVLLKLLKFQGFVGISEASEPRRVQERV